MLLLNKLALGIGWTVLAIWAPLLTALAAAWLWGAAQGVMAGRRQRQITELERLWRRTDRRAETR